MSSRCSGDGWVRYLKVAGSMTVTWKKSPRLKERAGRLGRRGRRKRGLDGNGKRADDRRDLPRRERTAPLLKNERLETVSRPLSGE